MLLFIGPRLAALAVFAGLGLLVSPAVVRDAVADDVEPDDLPSSPHDLDAELTKIDPSRAAADVLRGIGLRHRVDHFDTFDDDPFVLLTAPPNPRIIDVDLMHARDCAFDRVHGGMCVLRGFDESPGSIDVNAYGTDNAQRNRFQILERILDSVDIIDP